jgi:hypothetical protein
LLLSREGTARHHCTRHRRETMARRLDEICCKTSVHAICFGGQNSSMAENPPAARTFCRPRSQILQGRAPFESSFQKHFFIRQAKIAFQFFVQNYIFTNVRNH